MRNFQANHGQWNSLLSYDNSNDSYFVRGTNYPDVCCSLPQFLHKIFQDINLELGHDKFFRVLPNSLLIMIQWLEAI
jgi:hypothetical protein